MTIPYNATFVASQIERLRADYPEIEDDAELLSDMIEGATDFNMTMERVVGAFLDAVSMKDAIALRQKSLVERGARYERKAEALRGLTMQLLKAAAKTKLALPEASLSLRSGYPSVVVDNMAELPQGFTKTDISPRKAEIKKAIEAGETIPGAHLEVGPDTVTIKTK